MARIEADAQGRILRFLADHSEEAFCLGPHPGATEQISFDEASNQTIVRSIMVSTEPWRLVSGTLYQDGKPVEIRPPSLETTERPQALALARGLKAYNDLANLTNAQTVAAIRANNRLTLILARLMKGLLPEIEGE